MVTTCWWASFARLAHLLARQGCEVSVLCPLGHAAHAVPGIGVFGHSAFQPMRALSRAIAAARPVMIVPGDDRAVRHLHRLYQIGSVYERALIERSLGSPLSHPILTSRVRVVAVARRLGIAVPDDCVVTTDAALEAWLDRIPGPWVVKVDGASAGTGVLIAATRTEARAAFRRLRARRSFFAAFRRLLINRDPNELMDWWDGTKPEVSVQRHVAGHPGNIAMFCKEGEVVAATSVDAVACWSETGPSTIVRLVERPAIMADARRLVRELRLTGFYGLDFMVEQASGRSILIELNPRATAVANIRLRRSGDLVGAAATLFSGVTCQRSEPVSDADLVAHFPLARHWEPDDPRLATCFQDIPADVPALMAAMLAPSWPDRPVLARLSAGLSRAIRRRISRRPAGARLGWWERPREAPAQRGWQRLRTALSGGGTPRPR